LLLSFPLGVTNSIVDFVEFITQGHNLAHIRAQDEVQSQVSMELEKLADHEFNELLALHQLRVIL